MDFYTMQSIIGVVVPVISVVAPLAGAIYTWIATKNAAARKEIADLAKRLDTIDLQLLAAAHTAEALASAAASLADHDRRISRVENDLQHLPSKNEMHDLQLVIVRLEGTVGRLEEKVTGIGHTVGNLDNYMRTEGKGAAA